MWHIRYPLVDTDGSLDETGLPAFITVATTRPETMLGDTAVMVHPEDERYTAPDRQASQIAHVLAALVPVIADELRRQGIWYRRRQGHARPTTQNDYQVGLRHNLPMITMLHARSEGGGPFGRRIPEAYQRPGPLCGP